MTLDNVDILEKFKDLRVLVIGDLMVDNYIRGEVNRISPEAPVQIVDIKNEEPVLGGAGNTVQNVYGLQPRAISVLSVVGNDSWGNWILKKFEEMKIDVDDIVQSTSRPTTIKTRIMVDQHQLLRTDKESRADISSRIEGIIIDEIKKRINWASVILISDYAKGVLTHNVLNAAIFEARSNGKPIIIDPKGLDFKKYELASFITPNKKEAGLVTGVNIVNNQTAKIAATDLIIKLKTDGVLITRGEEGMSLFVKNQFSVTAQWKLNDYYISAQAQEVYDITGAGDTVMVVFGMAIAAGAKAFDAAYLANLAGGIVVGKVGTSVITTDELLEIL